MAAFRTSHYRRSMLGLGVVVLLAPFGCQSVKQTPAQVAERGTAAASAMGDARSRTGRMAINAMDADLAPDAGFLPEPHRLVEIDRNQHPFQRVWVDPAHDRERYSKILIPPVDIDHTIDTSRWSRMSTASFFGLEDDVDRLALRLGYKIEEAFRNDPQHRFVVVDDPDAETLILEIALVEVVPNKSVMALGALAAMAAPPAVSVPIGTLASRAEHGYVAIEGRVRDGESGEIVAMFADRETGKTRVVDLQSLHWYGHAFEIFDEWAEQLVAVANQPLEPGIPDPRPYSLRPW